MNLIYKKAGENVERILIYPYSKAYEAFVRYQNLLKDKEIVEVVSPRGWGLEDDYIESCNGWLKVSCEFSESLAKCTTVWFVEDERLELPEKLLWKKLQETILNHKQIIYTRFKNKYQYERAVNLIPRDQNITPNVEIPEMYWTLKKSCYSINTPVLVIFGIEENTEKFEIQVALRERFISKGYKISSITSRRDSELFCMHSIPAFMFGNELTEVDKIIQYNHYVKYIEQIEKPELMIIGIPGGIMPYDKVNHNHFGIMAYEISFAIPCDVSIMCLPYSTNFTGDYYDIKKDIYGKFRFDIECCHIAAVTIDTQTIVDDGKRNFVSLEKEFVRNKILLYNKKDVLDLTNEADLEWAIDNIIEKLSSYCY